MQVRIVLISLNSSAICSHSSEVGTCVCVCVYIYIYIYIGCSTFQMGFPDSRTIPCTAFFELEKSIPKTQMISQWQDT